jgi:predicted RNase H-like HicB family nuclease
MSLRLPYRDPELPCDNLLGLVSESDLPSSLLARGRHSLVIVDAIFPDECPGRVFQCFWMLRLEPRDISMKFSVLVERDEDGYYIASIPQLPGYHTQTRTLGELTGRVKEAIELHLEKGLPELSVNRLPMFESQ